MNNICHNCGANLNNNKICPNCGTKAFEKKQEYSDFTTKTLNNRILIICAIIIFIITAIVTIIFVIKGIKPKIVEYDTSYNQNNYKCSKATNCQNEICTYINEDGGEEIIHCSNTNWYNQNTKK